MQATTTTSTAPVDTATSSSEHLVDVLLTTIRLDAGHAAEARHILEDVLHPELAQAFNTLVPRSAGQPNT
jgi:hypothetical protein